MEDEQALAAGKINELPAAPKPETETLLELAQDQVVNQPYLVNDNVDLNALKALRDSQDIDGLFAAAHSLLVALDERVTSPDVRKID